MERSEPSGLERELKKYCSLDSHSFLPEKEYLTDLSDLREVALSCYELIVDAANYYLQERPDDEGEKLDTLINKLSLFHEKSEEYLPFFEVIFPFYSELDSFDPKKLAKVNKVFIWSQDVNLILNNLVWYLPPGSMEDKTFRLLSEFKKRAPPVFALEEFRDTTVDIYPNIFLENNPFTD